MKPELVSLQNELQRRGLSYCSHIERKEEARPLFWECTGSVGAVSLYWESLAMEEERGFLAWVDAMRQAEVEEHWPWERVLWVGCGGVRQAIRATDLLLRDGNFGVVFLDLRGVPPRELRGIPSPAWHRFQHLVEETGTRLVVGSPEKCASAARARLAVRRSAGGVRDLLQKRGELALERSWIFRGAEERRAA